LHFNTGRWKLLHNSANLGVIDHLKLNKPGQSPETNTMIAYANIINPQILNKIIGLRVGCEIDPMRGGAACWSFYSTVILNNSS
jgi:hypothetical protein